VPPLEDVTGEVVASKAAAKEAEHEKGRRRAGPVHAGVISPSVPCSPTPVAVTFTLGLVHGSGREATIG
jgi:hypothetical protein